MTVHAELHQPVIVGHALPAAGRGQRNQILLRRVWEGGLGTHDPRSLSGALDEEMVALSLQQAELPEQLPAVQPEGIHRSNEDEALYHPIRLAGPAHEVR